MGFEDGVVVHPVVHKLTSNGLKLFIGGGDCLLKAAHLTGAMLRVDMMAWDSYLSPVKEADLSYGDAP